MKKRKSETEVKQLIKNEDGCCAPSIVSTKKVISSDPCCEQPTNGSSCCDKNENKEVNAQNTGCC